MTKYTLDNGRRILIDGLAHALVGQTIWGEGAIPPAKLDLLAHRIVDALNAFEGEPKDRLKVLVAAGLTQRDALEVFGVQNDGLVDRARAQYAQGSNDDVEVDSHPLISESEGGTWVAAWVWVAK